MEFTEAYQKPSPIPSCLRKLQDSMASVYNVKFCLAASVSASELSRMHRGALTALSLYYDSLEMLLFTE